MKASLVAAAALAALASPALADTSVNLGLSLAGDAEIKTVQYNCDNHDPVAVQYVNAAPNFLALLSIDGKSMVFVSVIAASGTKYASGPYELWSKGNSLSLQDVTEGLDAAPVFMCTADNQAP